MAQENVKVVGSVRIPLPGDDARDHRSLDERILVRFPSLARRSTAAWARLPRNSQLRRAILVRRVRQAYVAVNRRDFDLILAGFDPGVEFHAVQTGPEGPATFHGFDGVREASELVFDVFGDIRLDPEELLDLGDRILITVKLSGHGAQSRASVSQRLFSLLTLRRGLIVRQHEFLDRAEALEALGLPE